MVGILDWLFGSAQAQTIPPIPPMPQGAVPQPVPATVPRTGNPLLGADRNVQIQAALAGLGQFGQNLAEQYRRRPVGAQPGPMGDVSGAVTRSMLTAYQRRQQEREEESERRWSELQAQNPALAGLPREVGQQVLARTLTREPPDPRRNFITTRTGIYRIGADGNPQLVQGPGIGGGGGSGAGGGAAAPGGAPFGAGEDSRAWGVILNPQADPSSEIYHAAWAIAARPRMQSIPDPNNPMGTILTEVRPDMSRFRPPAQPAATGLPAIPIDPRNSVAGGAGVIGIPAAPQPVPGAVAPPAAAPTVPGGSQVTPIGSTRMPPATLEAVRRFENESGRVLDAINNFERLANDAGPGTRFNTWIQNPTDPAAAAIQQAYNNMVTTLRSEAFLNTGVLQPAEMGMIRDMLRDPTSWRGALTTPEARTAQLDQIRQMIQSGIARQRASIGPQTQPGQSLQPVIDQPQAAPAVPPRGAAPAAPGQQAPRGTPLPMRAGPDGRQVPDDMRLRDGEIYIAPSGMRGRYNAARRTFTPVE